MEMMGYTFQLHCECRACQSDVRCAFELYTLKGELYGMQITLDEKVEVKLKTEIFA